MKRVYLPLTKKARSKFRAGEELLLRGRLYTARDMAHKRLYQAIKLNKYLPIDLTDNILYYCGPTPAPPRAVIGSCGPTTSKRMDLFTPVLLKSGLAGSIGKGRRSDEVIEAVKRYGCLYLAAIGGAGAYLSEKVKEARQIAYEDLGPEAIYELRVEDFPVIVAIDAAGNNLFKERL
ncbi:MAG: FumA C-terminus/TtdB family hydratase beta subunit [Candidatus Omnitrophica bacterium]|jgi:fumarate hydratase subunit beta|nr:FumA C-terminus/TtdB family hydratase beta subunit [Candidatus Omnitrophota bacterium]